MKAAYLANYIQWELHNLKNGKASEVMDTIQVVKGLILLSAKHRLRRAECLQRPPKPARLGQSQQVKFRSTARAQGSAQPLK